VKAFAYLTVVVLAIIGIGVGVVASTTNQKLYGPSWGRFTVAFPGRVYGFQTVQRGSNSMRSMSAASFDYATFPQGWTGYAPLSIPNELDAVHGVAPRGTGSAFAGAVVRSAKNLYFHAGVAESVQAENGYVTTTIGPLCINSECKEIRVVTNDHAFWEVAAFSRAPVSTVESFIESFQPIG
jgi:hypothetical protein